MVKLFSKFMGRRDKGLDPEEFVAIESDGSEAQANNPGSETWLEDSDEGQLSVDVFQTPDHIVIKSTIAGVKPDDIDIAINNDMITIRGERTQEHEVEEEDFFYQECYWGAFSRSIILPVEVKAEEVEASLKNGVLTIKLPKAKKSKSIAVRVKTE